jgi:hypothetical protein
MRHLQRAQLEEPHGLPRLWGASPVREDRRATGAKGAHGGRASGEGSGAERKTGRLDVRWLHVFELCVEETVPPVQYAET